MTAVRADDATSTDRSKPRARVKAGDPAPELRLPPFLPWRGNLRRRRCPDLVVDVQFWCGDARCLWRLRVARP